MIDKCEETLPNTCLTIHDFRNHIDGTKNHGVLKIITKIQFHQTTLSLTNSKPLTNWQAFASMRLNLNMDMNSIFNFVIQFQILNLC